MKDCSMGMIRGYLKTTTVRLDNRLTNRKSNTCSTGLCCKEGLENTVSVFPIYSGSRILYRNKNIRRRFRNYVGLNPQQAGALDEAHCINRICTQIEKNLLQLAPISNKLRQSLTQFKRDRYSLSSQIDFNHCDDLSNEVVDSELRSSVKVLLEHRPDAGNDFVRTLAVLDDTRNGGTRLIEIGGRVCHPTQGGSCISDHRAQRLVDLVSY